MAKKHHKRVIYQTDETDDVMYMESSFKVIASSIKRNGLEFEHERQGGDTDTVILYEPQVRELHAALTEFLSTIK